MDVLGSPKTSIGLCVLFIFMCITENTSATKTRTHARGAERLNPPLDIELETINCTAVRIQWRVPWRHVSTVTGYKVFYTEMRNGHPASSAVALNVPLNLAVLTAVKLDRKTVLGAEVGRLGVAAHYAFSVGAYGWAGEGRPSVPRRISTLPQEMCTPPAAPSRPWGAAVSDTEISLWWEPSPGGSGTLLRTVVAYIRPEVDSEWVSVEVSASERSAVLKGLDPDTQYQFTVQAVNTYGASPTSAVSDPVWTHGMQRWGSGGSDRDPSATEEEQTYFHSAFDVAIQEPLLISVEMNSRSQLRSRAGISQDPERPFNDRRITLSNSTESTPVTPVPTYTTRPPPPPPSPTISPTLTQSPPAASRGSSPWRGEAGQARGLHDLPCEDAVCPPHSVCVDDYQQGGSRCYCGLGRGGGACTQVAVAQYPMFSGCSHVAFEPLKNSYHQFHITLDFKPDSDNGLLLFCGENEQSDGDYASLALIHGKLHFRFNCGTGGAQIVSVSGVVLGQWHRVVVSRQGVRGWLRLDSNAPVTGHSEGDYTKITFRTPLYLGGSPNAYWLARTAGTNRGFRGCVQKLKINHRLMDMRPWPIGQALSGADVRECRSAPCAQGQCANGGTCLARSDAGHLCLCPLGYRGHLCRERFQIVAPLFSASDRSYASAPWPHASQHYLSFMELHLVVQPAALDGTLLHCQDPGGRDFLSLTLVGGFLELHFDCGSGVAVVRSEEAVTLNEWHDLRVSRTGREGVVQADHQTPTRGMAEGAFTQLSCSSPLYIGGVPDYSGAKPQAALLQSFTGTIQKVAVNGQSIRLPLDLSAGVNIDNGLHPCVDNPCVNGGTCRPKRSVYQCVCPWGYAGTHCQRDMDDSAVPRFTGRSYLSYDDRDILKRLSGLRTHVHLRFRSRVHDGLLLWRGHTHTQANSDFVTLGLKDGALVFSYNLGSGVAMVIVNGSFSDGEWHRVHAARVGQYGRLTVDHESSAGRSPGNMRQLNTNAPLFVGGMKEVVWRSHSQSTWGLVGCISHLSLSADDHLSLLDDAAGGKNVHSCS